MSRHLRHTVDPGLATAMLAGPRLAVVGASGSSGNFGATILHELRSRGIDAVAVHPTDTSLEGVDTYPSLADVPGTVDAVIVMVGADRAVDVVRECATLGITKVWLFRGIGGAGAASDEAIELATELGLDVVPGACPLMFLEPVGWFHRVHRSARRARGALAAA